MVDQGWERPEAEESGVSEGCFRRRRWRTEGPEDRQRTARAVAQARLGDREALRFLYVRYADSVYGYVESLVHDQHEAEDITQQVFAKLMSILVKYEQREASFLSWILTVSRHLALDEVRRQRAIPCEEVLPPDRGTPGADPLDPILVWEALADLPEEQRQVVVLRHLVGLSPSEIATSLGRSESSIHGLHHRGRGSLCLAIRQLGLAPAVMAP
jgi:RNA polymerase sigma-70 factor (ECF subfamily)